ncbi:MAG: DUF6340 family protein, partial [Tannerellaceae bacterium]|nr:DUF6340 family protein [Tannerellaceae bacterium]
MRCTFLIPLIWLLLPACSTISYITIETYNPAEITFPDPTGTILIVNNAIPQPAEMGYEYTLKGKAQDSCRANADSALFDVCKALGEMIVENGFFEDVLLYHLPTRTDEVFYSDKKLTLEQINTLCYENNVNAIISLDRLLFYMSKEIQQFSEGYYYGTIDVKMTGIVRSYLPGRVNPLATILVNDSIYWGETASSLVHLNKLLPKPEDALRTAGKYIGEKIHPNFVPYWLEEGRWLYKGYSTTWKEATAFAMSGKWDNAYQKWYSIYQHTKSWKEKAITTANIALY